ncbi:MAG: hypothetical protein QNJ70_31090 [Xenococcaceae cyanobacterium MO_207.B15]|nr:hypothetical protein [Xenococcaceae cyanobacterium MO_207.B15]
MKSLVYWGGNGQFIDTTFRLRINLNGKPFYDPRCSTVARKTVAI